MTENKDKEIIGSSQTTVIGLSPLTNKAYVGKTKGDARIVKEELDDKNVERFVFQWLDIHSEDTTTVRKFKSGLKITVEHTQPSD